jgi:hypothetical protein
MVDSVSSFHQALNFQYAVLAKKKTQIRYTINELNSASIQTPAPIKPQPIRRASLAGGGSSRVGQSAKRGTSAPSSSIQSNQQQVTSNRTITPQQRTRTVTSSSGNAGNGTQSRRIRKAIANTQADKRGRDSGGLTTLATSGIDGKGLKINRIR